MSYDLASYAAFLATALGLLAYLPYVLDTLAGRTRPERASWLIWSVLSLVAFAAQISGGATASLGFVAANVACTVFVTILSIRCGTGGWSRPGDRKVLVAAAVGLVLWTLTDNPVWALSITITISLAAGVLTLAKAYKSPRTETLTTWMTCCAASLYALLAADTVDVMQAAYPAYLALLSAAISATILLGRTSRHAPVTSPARRLAVFPFR